MEQSRKWWNRLKLCAGIVEPNLDMYLVCYVQALTVYKYGCHDTPQK